VLPLERVPDDAADLRLVVDDEQGGGRHAEGCVRGRRVGSWRGAASVPPLAPARRTM
jgi:hypothetical protein